MMIDTVLAALLLMIPVVVGGVLHMVVVTKNLFPRLTIPVNRTLFGANKTWRGFVVMPLLSIPGGLLMILILSVISLENVAHLVGYGGLLIGLALGFAYVLFELPNSFIKRRLGAAPGEVPEKGKWFFVLVDQIDSGVGAAVFYWAFFAVSWQISLVYMLLFPLVALLVKRFLFMAKLKKSYV